MEQEKDDVECLVNECLLVQRTVIWMLGEPGVLTGS
jgi:hypothetical protein